MKLELTADQVAIITRALHFKAAHSLLAKVLAPTKLQQGLDNDVQACEDLLDVIKEQV